VGRIANFRDLGCLVTGASSGIGRAIALRLADEGARLVVTARRLQRLEALCETCLERGAPEAHALSFDLSKREDVAPLIKAAEKALGHVDVLINNAGFSVPGSFSRSKPERTTAMLEVNVVASTLLMRGLLPGMVRRNRGGVLNVASVASFQAAPYQAGYAGTKSYLLNLSESVHQEVKDTGVVVTALCPGVTDTEFFDAAGYKRLGKFMERRMPADEVARAGLAGLRKGRMTVIPGFLNRTLVFTERFVPRSLVAAMSRRLMGGRKTKPQ
jgi:short-subunit dehydrogenase